jgi:hypothetical protein
MEKLFGLKLSLFCVISTLDAWMVSIILHDFSTIFFTLIYLSIITYRYSAPVVLLVAGNFACEL